jgi:hypothetical protein
MRNSRRTKKRTDYAWLQCQRQAFGPHSKEILVRCVTARHNWKPLLRHSKETGCRDGGARDEGEELMLENGASIDLEPASARPGSPTAAAMKVRESALQLMEEINRACCEHAEQRHTHCHCEIHNAS